MKKLYVLQYSVQQQCFHVTSMHNTIEINVGVFLNNSPLEYIPILYSSDKMVLLELTEKLTNIRLDPSQPFTEAQRIEFSKVLDKYSDQLTIPVPHN
jgi:hypothetical protein